MVCKLTNIKIWRLLVFSALFLLQYENSMTQNHQLAGFSYIFYPNSGLKDDARDTKFAFQEYGGFVKIPYRFKNKKTIIVNGLSYACLYGYISNHSIKYDGDNTEKLQFLTFQTIVAHKLRDDLNIVFSLRPTIASDFEERLSWDDFIMQGFLFLSKQHSENLSIGLGLANTIRLGKTLVIPIIPFRYTKNKHSLNTMLPLKLDYIYCIDHNEKLKMGFRETVNGGNINITASYNANSTIPEIDKINYSRINLSPVFYYNITKYIQIEILGGISIRRRYNLLDIEGTTHKMYLKEAPFLQLGMFFTPPKNK